MIAEHEKESNEIDKMPESKVRRPYEKPRLEMLGDLRSLTLGGSIGIDDPSGDFNTDNPFI
ncbi:MAG TPA: lasso RiPP family leader peptide-containing protein [Anaerolineales bacterium]|nr:lasso RiPP family leader peptide-containing protein [Anaerolineales bacterium]